VVSMSDGPVFAIGELPSCGALGFSHDGGLFCTAKVFSIVKKAAAILLLLAAFAQFGVRALRHRDDIPLWDFASVWSASRTWLHAGDPYDVDAVRATWRQSAGPAAGNIGFWSSVYPPTSLTMLAPVALLPPRLVLAIWFTGILALLTVQFAVLLDMAGLPLSRRDPRGWLLIAGSLFSAPVQFGVLAGQPSTPAIALCIIAIWCSWRQRERLAGMLLGLACAWKPQIATPFVVYYLVLRRWRAVEPALVTFAFLAALSLAAMQLSHVDWMHGWADNVKESLAVGGVNDRAPTGPFRDEIIDLQILLASFVESGRVLRLAAACILATLLAWYVRSYPWSTADGSPPPREPRTRPSAELLPLAALSALSLMAVYHRVYDALVLTLALAWALAELHGPRRRFALVALGLLSVFLVPFDILSSITARLPSLADVFNSWWWAAFIEPHYAWGLLAVTLCLLWTMSRQAQLDGHTSPSHSEPHGHPMHHSPHLGSHAASSH